MREAVIRTQLACLLPCWTLGGLGVEFIKETLIHSERGLVLLGPGVMEEA